jgi:hypothetical protein
MNGGIAQQERVRMAMLAEPLRVAPVTTCCVEPDRFLIALLTRDKPLTAFEQAYVDRAEGNGL